MVARATTFTNHRGGKAGHYEWDKAAGKFVRVSDKPVKQVGVHGDRDAPFAARIRAGLRRQEEKGGRFAHSVNKLKSTWGN